VSAVPGRTAAAPAGAAPPSRTILLAGLAWLAVATAAGGAGLVSALPPFALPLTLIGLTATLLVLPSVAPGFRAWLAAGDVRWLVALHLTRYVGAYFLHLHARGELPYAFAVPGGWGDIAVATLAAAVLLSGPPASPGRRTAWAAWNVIGLVDIVFVVGTAGYLVVTAPGSIAALARLPLSLLATFLVPLIIASHVVLAVRLARDPRRG
jgi:hypothetical protein